MSHTIRRVGLAAVAICLFTMAHIAIAMMHTKQPKAQQLTPPQAERVEQPETPFGQAVPYGQDPLDILNDIVVVDARAEIVIEGPAELNVGKLGKLSVKRSSGRSFEWRVLPAVGLEFEVCNDGRTVLFSSDTVGKYVFIVACAFQDDVDIVMHEVTVVDGLTPAPEPSTPVVNDDDLSTVARIIKMTEQVETCCLKAEAGKLAASFKAVRKLIEAGELPDTTEVILLTAKLNHEALGDDLAKWVPFLDALKAELQKRAEAGTLVTPDQYGNMWDQIIEALTVVSKG